VWEFLEQTERRIAQSKWGCTDGPPMTINELANEYLAELTIKSGNAWTFGNYKTVVMEFLEWCKKKNLHHVLDFKPEIVRIWIVEFPDDLSRETIKYKHGILSGMWRHAQQNYIVRDNPWQNARVPKMRNPEKVLESF
jgi:site-specific recombinase XerD